MTAKQERLLLGFLLPVPIASIPTILLCIFSGYALDFILTFIVVGYLYVGIQSILYTILMEHFMISCHHKRDFLHVIIWGVVLGAMSAVLFEQIITIVLGGISGGIVALILSFIYYKTDYHEEADEMIDSTHQPAH